MHASQEQRAASCSIGNNRPPLQEASGRLCIMTALGDDSFINDLDGLGDDSEDEEEEEKERREGTVGNGGGGKSSNGGVRVKAEDLDSLDDSEDEDEEEGRENGRKKRKMKEGGEEGMDVERGSEFEKALPKLKGKTLDVVATLSKTRRYQEHLEKVKDAISIENPPPMSVPLESDPEYQLIVSSNRLVQDIDEEILTVHRFVVDLYSLKFPELESLVPNKLDYVRTVQKIGNEMDLTIVDLNDLLPSATVMVVSVTASSTSGKPLPPSLLSECLGGCDAVLSLMEARSLVLSYVERRMSVLAPNTCALVGSKIAAQLMGLAGGLVSLSRIPASHIQVMGQEKKHLQGMAAAQGIPHAGVLIGSDVVMSAPPALRQKALRLVARRRGGGGEGGRAFRAECEDKIMKWQEPSKGKEKKALPVPEMQARKKRAGKRVSKAKERFAMTEMRKEHGRRAFGGASAGAEYGDEAMGMDTGMLGSQGGRLRLPGAKEQKQNIGKKKKEEMAKMAGGGGSGGGRVVLDMGGGSGATGGMASSLVFTPTQGLELVNPNAMEEKKRRLEEANKSWFDSNSGFMSAKPK
ncbi:u4 u6 small nuclear ribonucleoprotein prp31-like [Nannochloropsis oceanica]